MEEVSFPPSSSGVSGGDEAERTLVKRETVGICKSADFSQSSGKKLQVHKKQRSFFQIFVHQPPILYAP